MIFELKGIEAAAPKQNEVLFAVVITGIGLTVMAVFTLLPVQTWLLVTNVGTMLIKPWAGDVPELVALKVPMLFPDPDAGRPIVVLELVQAYCVPLKFEEKLSAAVAFPLQTVCVPTAVMTGVGNTTISNVCGAPQQVLPADVKLGVTVIVAVRGALVVFVALKDKAPVPEATRPIAVLLFVQL